MTKSPTPHTVTVKQGDPSVTLSLSTIFTSTECKTSLYKYYSDNTLATQLASAPAGISISNDIMTIATTASATLTFTLVLFDPDSLKQDKKDFVVTI